MSTLDEEIQQLFTDYQTQGRDIAVSKCNPSPQKHYYGEKPTKSRMYDMCDNIDRYYIQKER